MLFLFSPPNLQIKKSPHFHLQFWNQKVSHKNYIFEIRVLNLKSNLT